LEKAKRRVVGEDKNGAMERGGPKEGVDTEKNGPPWRVQSEKGERSDLGRGKVGKKHRKGLIGAPTGEKKAQVIAKESDTEH